MITTFEEVYTYAFKRGKCSVCGGSAERSKKFTNTVNPWNRNEDGTTRTYAEVQDNVNRLAREWEEQPVVHARCEGQARAAKSTA